MARFTRVLENPTPIRAFGMFQVVLLIAILISVFLFWRKRKRLEDGIGANINAIDVRAAIQRAKLAQRPDFEASETNARESKPAPRSEALESALPTWGKDTPPHEILGVASSADAEAIEAAYKLKLKKYHPDRFASWGRGYQTRAHQIIVLLQDARDRMLKRAK